MKGIVFLVLLSVILSTFAALTRTWARAGKLSFKTGSAA
jgi:hypothetical protein